MTARVARWEADHGLPVRDWPAIGATERADERDGLGQPLRRAVGDIRVAQTGFNRDGSRYRHVGAFRLYNDGSIQFASLELTFDGLAKLAGRIDLDDQVEACRRSLTTRSRRHGVALAFLRSMRRL